jgi:hypothetical protein
MASEQQQKELNSVDIDDPFGFDVPINRKDFHTVKYDLSSIFHGECAQGTLL